MKPINKMDQTLVKKIEKRMKNLHLNETMENFRAIELMIKRDLSLEKAKTKVA